MNYKYRTSDAAFVLSEDEHNKILEQMKQGNSMIVLREGKLLLNTKYLKSVNPTADLTDEQEERRYKTPALPAPAIVFDGLTFQERHFKVWDQMKWEHSENCLCKKWNKVMKTMRK